MPRDVGAELADAHRHVLVAPAGHGKSRAIAEAVARVGGRQLVLTHTHAGVRSLRRHLAVAGVDPRDVTLETIAGFARRWARSYPTTSGWTEDGLVPQWDGVYSAASKVLERPQLVEAVGRSFDGLFIDEYQDCTEDQHALVLQLAAQLPSRLLGDPLQGIFRFGDQKLVSFEEHVFPEFDELDELDTPWRWVDRNPALGDDLLQIRDDLLHDTFDFTKYKNVRVVKPHPAAAVMTCRGVEKLGGTAVAIRGQPGQAHALAKMLGGSYTSMEEAEGRSIIEAAAQIESADGPGRAAALLEVLSNCTTKVVPDLGAVRAAFVAGDIPNVPAGKKGPVVQALVDLSTSHSLEPLGRAIRALCTYPEVVVYRPEVPVDLAEAGRLHLTEPYPALAEAAVAVRDRGRRFGRALPPRVVSRTLLVKGLEFDHAIAFDTDAFDRNHLYVALTRASRTVTVVQ